MAPPQSRIDELEKALRSPWLPYSIAREIYVAYKLIPSYEDFVKERESELEHILKRRPMAVPKIIINVTSNKDNSSLRSKGSDSSCEKSVSKCDVEPEEMSQQPERVVVIGKTMGHKKSREIIKTSKPRLFISTEVEFTKESVQEKPSLDAKVKPSLTEINITKTKDVDVKTALPEIRITKTRQVEVKTTITERSITKSLPLVNAEISLTKSQRPDNTFPSLPGIDSRKPIFSPTPEIVLRRKSETLDSVVTKTIESKKVNIIRNPALVDDGNKIEPKASITRILTDIDIERKSTNSVPKTKNIKKQNKEQNKETKKSVSHKRNNSSDVKEDKGSKFKTPNLDKNRKSSSELTSNQNKKSKSSEEIKSLCSKNSKRVAKEPTLEEVNIERKSANPVPKLKYIKDKRDNRKSSSEERKSNSHDRISDTHISQTASLKRKSKDKNISSDVNLPLNIKCSKKRKSHETTNSKQNEDKKSHPETSNEISKQTEKTQISQERDSSKKLESNNHKREQISKHSHITHHGSKHESHKDHQKSTGERRKHTNSEDNEIEPEKKKPRTESKSTDNVLEIQEKSRGTVRLVSSQKSETTDATVPPDTPQNIKRRRQSNLRIQKDPADFNLFGFTSYSCSKCATEFSSHYDCLNHQNHCKFLP